MLKIELELNHRINFASYFKFINQDYSAKEFPTTHTILFVFGIYQR